MIDLYERLGEKFNLLANDRHIEELIVGLGYTYVDTGGELPGLAYTFRFETDSTCSPLREAGTIRGARVRDISTWIDSSNILKISVFMATLNSMIPPPERFTEADITELPEVREATSIAMIGFFEPVVRKLRKMNKRVSIFEKREIPGENVFRDWEIPYRINHHQVAIISSTTIINKTLPVILEFIDPKITTILLGPSTPLLPDLFSRYKVDYLAGTLITNREKVKQIIMEGAGSRVFGENVKRIITLV